MGGEASNQLRATPVAQRVFKYEVRAGRSAVSGAVRPSTHTWPAPAPRQPPPAPCWPLPTPGPALAQAGKTALHRCCNACLRPAIAVLLEWEQRVPAGGYGCRQHFKDISGSVGCCVGQ